MSLGQDSNDGLVDELPLKQGAVFGAAAFVVSYALTYVLLTVDSEIDLDQIGQADFVSAYEVVGWVFYNAHFVDTESTGPGGSETASLLSEETFQFPSLVYYAVPIVVLVAAGYLLVDRLGDASLDSGDAAKAGATVVAGYLPLAVIGAVAFTVDESQQTMMGEISISVGPELGSAVLLAGVAFPLVLGAVGGVLQAET